LLPDKLPKPKAGGVVFVPAKVAPEAPSNTIGLISTIAQVLTALVTVILVAKK
jgi:hypothetical protein